jgi:16S rRNA (adenine(1408)-N(1))-methyltransferase
VAARSNISTTASLENLPSPTGGGVIVDIGTGDGRFVYESAKDNPEKFFIGIDPNTKPLEKISMKATRKPAKGGLANVLFIRAAIEQLPKELDNAADQIHIHFPWGSLLGAIALGDERILRSLHRLCARGCLLEVVIGFDPERDRQELERLGIADFSLDYVRNKLVSRYSNCGLKLKESGVLGKAEWTRLHSSWARRLSLNDAREVVYFIAEAQK